MQQADVLNDIARRLDELVPTMQQAAEAIAELLQHGKLDAGYRELRLLIEALEHFEKGLGLLESAGVPPARDLSNLKAKLNEVYPAILTALEEQDSVLLADVLQYELAPALAAYHRRAV